MEDQAQSLIDATTAAFKANKMINNPIKPGTMPPGLPPMAGLPPFPPNSLPPGMPPPGSCLFFSINLNIIKHYY